MMRKYAGLCYRLAINAAGQNRLSHAAALAAHCISLDDDHQNARRLLGLCLYELGDLAGAERAFAAFPHLAAEVTSLHEQTENALGKIRDHMAKGKWRAALGTAKEVPHQSVRLLRIQGCILAEGKRYHKAAKAFSSALDKDRGNREVACCLAEAAARKPSIWEVLA